MSFKEIKLDKGVFMVSIDLELAWGFNYELLIGSKTAEKYLKIIRERSRRNIKRLLDLAERFKIPFTWGIVGHLFLTSCNRSSNGIPHSDMPRPDLNVNKDWYANDPCSSLDADPIWYGADVIRQILESRVEHEVACHSFSHVDFSKCSKEVALAEVRKCKEVMKDFGIEPKSFIFPKNRIAHLNILEQEGFKVFRFKAKSHLKHPFRELSLVEQVLFPTTRSPLNFKNLVAVPSSLLFQSPHIYDTLIFQLAIKKGADLCVKDRKIFHITMHDYLETDYLLLVLANSLSYVRKLRDQGSIEITTFSMFQELI